MSARLTLILALLLSLVLTTETQSTGLPAEMKQGGGCVGMQCARACCANTACCVAVEQKQFPQKPAQPQRLPQDWQFLALELRAYIVSMAPLAPRGPLVIRDEIRKAHTLPPLAANCIQLI